MSRDWDWIKPASVLVLAQHFGAVVIAHAVGFPNTPPTASYVIMAMVLATAAGMILLLAHLWTLWRQGVEDPLRRITTPAIRLVALTYYAGFLLVALQIAALTWLKEMIPFLVPYWADPLLARIDRIFLFGDAWRLIPSGTVKALDFLYTLWAPFKFFALFMMLAAPASKLKSQAMLSYFLVVGLLGVVGEYVLSSGGPIFFDRLVGGESFAELIERTREHAKLAYGASEYLWASYTAGDTRIGNGISAMPSMHVATTVWASLALCARWPHFRWVVWPFAFMILAGSVGLGWHYLSDGVVGGLGAVLCWKLAPILLDRLHLQASSYQVDTDGGGQIGLT